MKQSQWKWVKLAGLIVGLAAAVAGTRALGLRWEALSPERVRAYVLSFGWRAPFVYTLLFAQPVIPLPISLLCMAGGVSFGLGWGFVAAWLAGVARGCGQFLIARVCGREAIASMLRGRVASLDQRIERRGFQAVLWIRLVPNVPFDLQNFGLGLSGVSFASFAAASILGVIPGVFLWVYLGSVLTHATQLLHVMLLLLGLGALWWFRLRRRHA